MNKRNYKKIKVVPRAFVKQGLRSSTRKILKKIVRSARELIQTAEHSIACRSPGFDFWVPH